MMKGRRSWLRSGLIALVVLVVSLALLESCMQFRMSRTEIDKYFSNKPHKGVLKQYRVDTRNIHYVIAGDSTLPLVVFVHGSPGSLSAFIDFLADTTLLKVAQLATIDRPGFGYSNFGMAEPSLKRQAACMRPLLEKHKGQRPIVLVGHSLGGPLVARMAMDFPELVDGLILVAPSIDPALEPNEWFRGPLATPFLKWMLPRSLRASNEEIYHLKPELEEMVPLWPRITAQTTVIQGKKDVLVPWANATFAQRMITNAPVKLMMVEDMNHFVPWSHPQLIRKAIMDFLTNTKE